MNFEVKKTLYDQWMLKLSPIEQARIQKILGEYPGLFDTVITSLNLKQTIASGRLSQVELNHAAAELFDLEQKAIRDAFESE